MNDLKSNTPGSNPFPAPTRSLVDTVGVPPEMQPYWEAINGTDEHAARLVAIGKRNAAAAQHQATVAARTNEDDILNVAKTRKRDADAAMATATLETAAQLRHEQLAADAVLIVAERNSKSARTEEIAAERALKDADTAVTKASERVLLAEWRAEHADFLRDDATMLARRERLIALDSAVSGLLSDRELWAVSHRKAFTTEFSGVVRVPLMSMDSGHFEERANSGRISAAAASWRKRLAELCEGQA